MAEVKKVDYFLKAPRVGTPSFDELMALLRALTGREPTAADLAEAEAEYDAHLATLAPRQRDS